MTAFAIIAVFVMAAVGAMLLVRRFAPRGGFFSDSDRAAGVFGVVGTGFAVLLAFVIFIAFESYNNAKDGATREAIAARQLFRTAMLFSPGDRDELHAELICYGRAVAFDEWRTMRAGRESALVQGWLERLDRSTKRVDVRGVKQAAASSRRRWSTRSRRSSASATASLRAAHFRARPAEPRGLRLDPGLGRDALEDRGVDVEVGVDRDDVVVLLEPLEQAQEPRDLLLLDLDARRRAHRELRRLELDTRLLERVPHRGEIARRRDHLEDALVGQHILGARIDRHHRVVL